jgi:hypothetical protein
VTAPTSDMGYVYLIGNTEHGWYKIGKSKDPDFRLSSIVINCPVALETILTVEADEYGRVESLLHSEFESKHMHGEWFALSADDLLRYKRLVNEYKGLTRDQLKTARQKIQKTKMLARIQESVRKTLKIKSKRHASSL